MSSLPYSGKYFSSFNDTRSSDYYVRHSNSEIDALDNFKHTLENAFKPGSQSPLYMCCESFDVTFKVKLFDNGLPSNYQFDSSVVFHLGLLRNEFSFIRVAIIELPIVTVHDLLELPHRIQEVVNDEIESYASDNDKANWQYVEYVRDVDSGSSLSFTTPRPTSSPLLAAHASTISEPIVTYRDATWWELMRTKEPTPPTPVPEIRQLILSFGMDLGPCFTKILFTKSIAALTELLHSYGFIGENIDLESHGRFFPATTDTAYSTFELDYAGLAKMVLPNARHLLTSGFGFMTNINDVRFTAAPFEMSPYRCGAVGVTCQPWDAAHDNLFLRQSERSSFGCVTPCSDLIKTDVYNRTMIQDAFNIAVDMPPNARVRGKSFLPGVTSFTTFDEELIKYIRRYRPGFDNVSYALFEPTTPWRHLINIPNWERLYNILPLGYTAANVAKHARQELLNAIVRMADQDIVINNKLGVPDVAAFKDSLSQGLSAKSDQDLPLTYKGCSTINALPYATAVGCVSTTRKIQWSPAAPTTVRRINTRSTLQDPWTSQVLARGVFGFWLADNGDSTPVPDTYLRFNRLIADDAGCVYSVPPFNGVPTTFVPERIPIYSMLDASPAMENFHPLKPHPLPYLNDTFEHLALRQLGNRQGNCVPLIPYFDSVGLRLEMKNILIKPDAAPIESSNSFTDTFRLIMEPFTDLTPYTVPAGEGWTIPHPTTRIDNVTNLEETVRRSFFRDATTGTPVDDTHASPALICFNDALVPLENNRVNLEVSGDVMCSAATTAEMELIIDLTMFPAPSSPTDPDPFAHRVIYQTVIDPDPLTPGVTPFKFEIRNILNHPNGGSHNVDTIVNPVIYSPTWSIKAVQVGVRRRDNIGLIYETIEVEIFFSPIDLPVNAVPENNADTAFDLFHPTRQYAENFDIVAANDSNQTAPSIDNLALWHSSANVDVPTREHSYTKATNVVETPTNVIHWADAAENFGARSRYLSDPFYAPEEGFWRHTSRAVNDLNLLVGEPNKTLVDHCCLSVDYVNTSADDVYVIAMSFNDSPRYVTASAKVNHDPPLPTPAFADSHSQAFYHPIFDATDLIHLRTAVPNMLTPTGEAMRPKNQFSAEWSFKSIDFMSDVAETLPTMFSSYSGSYVDNIYCKAYEGTLTNQLYPFVQRGEAGQFKINMAATKVPGNVLKSVRFNMVGDTRNAVRPAADAIFWETQPYSCGGHASLTNLNLFVNTVDPFSFGSTNPTLTTQPISVQTPCNANRIPQNPPNLLLQTPEAVDAPFVETVSAQQYSGIAPFVAVTPVNIFRDPFSAASINLDTWHDMNQIYASAAAAFTPKQLTIDLCCAQLSNASTVPLPIFASVTTDKFTVVPTEIEGQFEVTVIAKFKKGKNFYPIYNLDSEQRQEHGGLRNLQFYFTCQNVRVPSEYISDYTIHGLFGIAPNATVIPGALRHQHKAPTLW
jgi:hypothetical protein